MIASFICFAAFLVAMVALPITYRAGRIKGFSQGYDAGREKGRSCATDSLLTTADSYGLVVFWEDGKFRFKTRYEIAKELETE